MIGGGIYGLGQTVNVFSKIINGNSIKAGESITNQVGKAVGEEAGCPYSSKSKSSGHISELLSGRPELSGTNREKLLSTVQNNKLSSYINELYRPGATIGDGGTADALISEFYSGKSTHLIKAQERLKGINKVINSGSLGLNDLDVAYALRDDLEIAIELFK
ncbi:hypothetical protein [Pseudobutyrivibrio xylanivorans]|uniref:Uncharacterized protein n=1 Tax=Pseudobutyrivibrio xylanivorans TaxID=185007 RepID=A0A1G5S511_PSEXY|nr:hypothetical protein [Pseudobutyrivibrio xylanivorans]SCZ81454.1 hypothetical protein SAMN02910350_02829 [Pseudobutyrivibrio xylanivorans]